MGKNCTITFVRKFTYIYYSTFTVKGIRMEEKALKNNSAVTYSSNSHYLARPLQECMYRTKIKRVNIYIE